MKTTFFALPLLLVACGGLDPNPNEKAPLATLVGQLSNPANIAPSPNGNIRVALLWGRGDLGEFEASTDLPVQPVFPAKFQLTIREAPPSAMLFNPFADDDLGAPPPEDPSTAPSAPGTKPMNLSALSSNPALATMRAGIATVVAYEDVNGNGKLDLVSEDAKSFVDRIVGADPELLVVYVDGAVPQEKDLRDSAGVLPASGYNLLRRGTPCAREATSDSLPNPEACTEKPTVWLPMSTLFELPLTSSPSVNRWMCKGDSAPVASGVGGAVAIPKQGRPAVYPVQGDPKLQCQADGTRYFYGTQPTCTTEYLGVCRGSRTTCTGGEPLEIWQRPDPVPSDWPCK